MVLFVQTQHHFTCISRRLSFMKLQMPLEYIASGKLTSTRLISSVVAFFNFFPFYDVKFIDIENWFSMLLYVWIIWLKLVQKSVFLLKFVF